MHAYGLAEGDGFFAVSWMATVNMKVMMGVSRLDK